jgi:LCP family protein required for cell wall assembly
MSEPTDAERAKPPRKRRVWKIVLATVLALVLVVVVGGFLVYEHLNGNITSLDTTKALGTDRPSAYVPKTPTPHQPLNILLLGSDTRQGKGNHIGGQTPGLSDTTILLHINAARTTAYGVSIPRDSMVQRPDCLSKDGKTTIPGAFGMFNEAYAIGGAGCTERTVEQLTGIRIDHFVVVDFNGFKHMVDALGGVEVCVPKPVHDDIGHINLPAGTYTVTGEQALDYVRVRHDISANVDIGRVKRQQAFLASMANKAISLGTLSNPVKLYKFLDAATKSLTTDPGLANLQALAGLANQLRGIGLENTQFLTVPFETYQPDPNRLVWAPEAKKLWRRIRLDKPLSHKESRSTSSASDQVPGSPGASPSTGASPSVSPTQAEQRLENGLCA